MPQAEAQAITIIDNLIGELSSAAASNVKEVQDILNSQKPQKQNPEDPHRVKAIWLQLKRRTGYETIAIIWRIVKYFHLASKKPYYQDIARGKGFCIPRRKFMAAVRCYHPEIQKELWEYEKTFAEIRLRQSLLSQARERLVLFQKRAGKPLEEID